MCPIPSHRTLFYFGLVFVCAKYSDCSRKQELCTISQAGPGVEDNLSYHLSISALKLDQTFQQK
jgi:hypothetical protein